jgi:hypothetical protein
MIFYDFQCLACGKINEKAFHVNDCPRSIMCGCGGEAKKIICQGHGGIQTDNDVKWLPSACQTLQREGERPITTRTEYKAYLKKNNLTPKA